jgi:hypothetical protein
VAVDRRREAAMRVPPRAPIAALSHTGAPTAVKQPASRIEARSAKASRGSQEARLRLLVGSIVGIRLDTVSAPFVSLRKAAEREEVLSET